MTVLESLLKCQSLSSLNLSNLQFTSQPTASALSNQSLRNLELNCCFSEATLKEDDGVYKIIGGCTGLKSLSLGCNPLADQGMAKLLGVLPNKVETLSLVDCQIANLNIHQTIKLINTEATELRIGRNPCVQTL
jgi:hypothetical protein